MLDVACGSGQIALSAAQDGINVTGVDIAPNLIRRAQARAKAEGSLRRTLEAPWSASNLASDGITVVPADYLEVVAIRA